MICKERSIWLPWFSTKTQIMTLFYLASRDAASWYIQLNMFLKLSGGNCPVDLPLIAGSASKTCQYHLEQWFSNFHEPWPSSKGFHHCGPLLIKKIPSLGLCSWLLLGLCTWPPENSSVASKGDERPGWETLT